MTRCIGGPGKLGRRSMLRPCRDALRMEDELIL